MNSPEIHFLKVRVVPNASKSGLAGRRENGVYRVRIAALAQDGKANAALLKFLAARLGIRKNQLRLEQGEKNREKTIRITGLSAAAIRSALEE